MKLSVHPPFLLKKILNSFIWTIPNKDKIIYLTFDDGPIPELTPWVLSVLKEYDAKATFFCVGDNVRKYPEIFQLILDNGHSIGNHTFNHINGWKYNSPAYLTNVTKARNLIHSKLFRPPYGKINIKQLHMLKKGYFIIMWDVLSRDFDNSISDEECYNNVIQFTKSGSIIVFHDNIKAEKHLKYSLPKILKHFTENGFSFHPITPLLLAKKTNTIKSFMIKSRYFIRNFNKQLFNYE